MKNLLYCLISLALLDGSRVAADVTYTNFIRQKQFPSLIQQDVSTEAIGTQLSSLAIDPGGARFELWTVSSDGPTSYLLSSNYVGTYIPVATVAIRSEDTTSEIPRTRADRPFYVDVTLTGLRAGATDPLPSKSIKFIRYVQSYGAGGTGIGVGFDRTQAIIQTQSSIATNGPQTLTFALTMIPGADRSKVRGEERFTAWSLEDYQAPESVLASQYIQVWPVADGSIAGITANQLVRYALPPVTCTCNDLYPFSTTYAQVYKGSVQPAGATGAILPGAITFNDSVPQDKVLLLSKYDAVFDADGVWTMELVTKTPFGLDRLAYVTFTLDRTMKMNGAFTTIE